MRSALTAVAQRRAGRARSSSLSAIPPSPTSHDYLPALAATAASILYRSPQPSRDGRPVYILNAAAFPDAFEVDYDSLLSYVLARLPEEDALLGGTEYEIIFFAGGQPEGATQEKKPGPGIGWYLQAYHVLGRATRKKLQRLYIVHPRTWVRVLIGVFGTVVSPKFRRKIAHVSTLSQLALRIPIEKLLIPPTVYLHDRKLESEIVVPYATGRRAFGARHPLPKDINTGHTRLPRVLREATGFLLLPANLRIEGLFRIPPHAVLLNVLKEAYDRGQDYIVWKEKGAVFAQPGIDNALLDEIRLEDAYGVYIAASLIKTWYRELRAPIFPESSYHSLRMKYSSQDVEVTPEDLVDLIMPTSPASPLSITGREIMTRHLLPLLSAVAEHEAENKMSADNLAICLSMSLVCGADQVEDARMSSIVRRILATAIEMWPQLRTGLGVDDKAFVSDLQPPVDRRDYEDPLDDGPKRGSGDDANELVVDHRIQLHDVEDGPPPKLPPRPPVQSVKPESGADIPTSATSIIRKPVLPVSMVTASELLCHSTIFSADKQSFQVADSPASYLPANESAPWRRGEWISDEKDDEMPARAAGVTQPPREVSKRTAHSSEQRQDSPAAISQSRSVSDPPSLAMMVAQEVATRLNQRITVPSPVNVEAQQPSQSAERPRAEANAVFRTPSWPGSANRHLPNVQSLARPAILDGRPQILDRQSARGLEVPRLPKTRAPSVGLMQRMGSMEANNGMQDKQVIKPRKLNLKKPSVDDLRRLYEERASTAHSLAEAEVVKRLSTTKIG